MKKSQIVIPFVAVFAVFSILAGLDHPPTVSAESSGTPYSAEWKITGPTGGDVRGLVVDPNDADRFYIGTLDGQIYTSTDGAHNWRLLVNFNRPACSWTTSSSILVARKLFTSPPIDIKIRVVSSNLPMEGSLG